MITSKEQLRKHFARAFPDRLALKDHRIMRDSDWVRMKSSFGMAIVWERCVSAEAHIALHADNSAVILTDRIEKLLLRQPSPSCREIWLWVDDSEGFSAGQFDPALWDTPSEFINLLGNIQMHVDDKALNRESHRLQLGLGRLARKSWLSCFNSLRPEKGMFST